MIVNHLHVDVLLAFEISFVFKLEIDYNIKCVWSLACCRVAQLFNDSLSHEEAQLPRIFKFKRHCQSEMLYIIWLITSQRFSVWREMKRNSKRSTWLKRFGTHSRRSYIGCETMWRMITKKKAILKLPNHRIVDEWNDSKSVSLNPCYSMWTFIMKLRAKRLSSFPILKQLLFTPMCAIIIKEKCAIELKEASLIYD